MSSYPIGEGEDKYRLNINRVWLGGSHPNYDVVNKLFEEGRKNVWPEGSLEDRVEKLVKTWEMELVHHPQEYLTMDPNNFSVAINGTKLFTFEQLGAVGGSYNLFLQTKLPPELRIYDPEKETEEGSNKLFKTVFPRGFAVEVIEVYSDKPTIVFQFRHFGYFEGEFKGQSPTGELVEFYGICIFRMNPNSELIEKVEFFYERGQLLAPLVKGSDCGSSTSSGCPFRT